MRYRNNLYFLLVTNINHVNEKSSSSIITEIEKNNKVCRKYVLESLEDLQRVPSLSDNLSKDTNSLFDFDSEFRKYLFDLVETEKTENSLSVELKEMIEVYFDYYDSQDENKEELKKKRLTKFYKKG
ncbi:ABC-three component system middle component 1 [Bacillus cereus]